MINDNPREAPAPGCGVEGLWSLLRCTVGTALLIASTSVAAVAQQSDTIPEAGKCWRFAFSAWTPPLDWARAGHDGRVGDLAERVRRVRDSIFVRDTSAVRNNAMYWERGAKGLAVVLFPPWWPVGLKVEFDSILAEGREMTGQATAFVANAGQEPARARARAARCPA
ncbi:MAG TPA: hypothetical protein VF981_03185 [Gemmatimonadaceae bacterium]